MILASYHSTMRHAIPVSKHAAALQRRRAAEANAVRIVRAMPTRVQAIVEAIVAKHGTSTARMLLKGSRGPGRAARNEICYILHSTPSYSGKPPSCVQIGKWLDGRDHTSIIHAIATHAEETGVPPLGTRDAKRRRLTVMERAERYRLARNGKRIDDTAEIVALGAVRRRVAALSMEAGIAA